MKVEVVENFKKICSRGISGLVFRFCGSPDHEAYRVFLREWPFPVWGSVPYKARPALPPAWKLSCQVMRLINSGQPAYYSATPPHDYRMVR